jgi:hypothetical protein
MYVGWTVVMVMTLGCLLGRGVRESPIKWTGVVLFLLGLGSFDPHAPWPLLHRYIPIFKSQHVPSRWLYPALLLVLAVTAAVLERILRRSGPVRGWLEIAMVAAVAWIAFHIAKVAREPMTRAFTNHMPAIADSTGPFRTEIHMPPELETNYSPDWAPPSLPAEMANIGTIDCGTFGGFHNVYRDHNGHAPGLGAHGRGDPAYQGEAYVPDGVGHATIASFTPNEISVRVTGAQAGEHVVLNQNWDAGWSADGMPALNWADTAAAQLHGRDSTVVFRYSPRFWYLGLALCLSTLVGIGAAYWVVRKMRAASRRTAKPRPS